MLRLFNNYKGIFSKYISKETISLPEKWKGGRVEKWYHFWEGLLYDYITVAKETAIDARSKPLKTAVIGSGLGILLVAVKSNPDELSFYDNHIKCISKLAMVGDPIRNPLSENHILYLTKSQNQGRLRKTDLLFLTLIWEADYDESCNIYASQCKYLKPQIMTFYQRIVDVGLFNIWLNLKLKMIDYDINPNEWIDKT